MMQRYQDFKEGAIVILLAIFLVIPFCGNSQSLIVIGDSTNTSTTTSYPCPYGNFFDDSRHQILFRASELIAEGMGEGDITSLAFKVDFENGITLNNYQIQMGMTTDSVLTPTLLGGLTNVWGPANFSDVQGWNTHTLVTPFYWDGVSNLLLQTCNNNFNNSQNPLMVLSSTSWVSTSYALANTGNICGGGGPGIPTPITSMDRPLTRFSITLANAPPVADFSPQNFSNCSGLVQFTDLSSYNPTSWLWNFGDGNTSIVQNPLHTYTVDGTYTVTLIVTNLMGADTLVVPNAITVNVASPQPIAACIPNTTLSLGGFGILQVDLEDVSVTSGDGQSEGYADRGCILDTVFAGSIFPVTILTGTTALHNVRAWVDWNGNGTFSAGELVLSADGVINLSGNVNVPAVPLLNTPLRMRIVADYELSPIPTACGQPQYGQAEDYGIVVIPSTQPPTANFTASPQLSCNGTVQFTDLSLNAPTAWQWDFGDSMTSTMQNPNHTYAASGTYTVTLIASNANGSDTETIVNFITVDLGTAPIAATCTPATTAYCCNYGIYNVQFESIMNTSGNASEGYQDFSCGNNTDVTEGLTYPISIQTGTQNPQDVFVWIDLNNDGAFSLSERLFSATNAFNPNGNMTIPGGAVLNTPLRMRISSDGVGNITTACSPPTFGQVEDYAVTIIPNTMPPVAAFSGSPTVSCDGIVQFQDLSTNVPLTWLWYFGDSNTSNQQNPMHTYASMGVYTISLVVTNAFGTDSVAIQNYINVPLQTSCDTSSVAQFPQVFTECFGVITDDGGPNGNYTPNGQGLVTIAPPGAQNVTLTFSQFEFQPNDDYLLIYDGPTNGSPLIGQFDGFGVGNLPNGGVITSSGGAISLQQSVAFGFNFFAGFIANWECTPIGIEEINAGSVRIWPNPTAETLNVTWDELQAPITNMQIVNSLGALMELPARSFHAKSTTIDVSDWASGLYSLIVNTERGVWNGTFIVE